MCATIAKTEAIGKCHLSALHLPLCFVLLDESVLFKRNVKFWSSIWELFPGACLFRLRKQPTFGDATIGFPAKLCLRNERRNSILMTHHYPDLTSACDWLNQISHATRPIKSITQIWVVMHHQYWISVLVSQTSFGRETSGSVAKCRLFSQATVCSTSS